MKQTSFYMFNALMMLFLVTIMILISVAFLTLFERKILSYIHYRKGPNKVSLWGLLQPFSDAMKLLTKQFFYPLTSNYNFYFISPFMMLILTMLMWMIYPFKTNLLNWNMNSLFLLCLMSMGVYGMMMSGWSSNSNYALLGSIRSIAQSISYEVTFSISFLLPLFMINSLNLNNFFNYQKNYFFMFIWPISLILLMSMFAELNRTPFDLSEGESELVSGFNVEYSSHGFTLIFLSEYSSIMFMMFLFTLMNFNLNLFNYLFYLLVIFWMFFTIWIRVTLPRIRYDLLMSFCWMYLLPMMLILFMIYMMNFNMYMYMILISLSMIMS